MLKYKVIIKCLCVLMLRFALLHLGPLMWGKLPDAPKGDKIEREPRLSYAVEFTKLFVTTFKTFIKGDSDASD